jgi:tetratricopeptide (TPR) repeat protein
MLLALAGLDFTFNPGEAFAKDKDERRALSLDELDAEQVRRAEYAAAAEEKRLEAISKLKSLLSDAEGDRKAEMMLRLADLYFEQGQALYFGEMEEYQNWYDDCFTNAPDPDSCDGREPDHTKSFSWYGKSVKLYEAILKGYPRYGRADQATFYLGMTYLELTRREDALASFKKLVKLYPTSQWVPDAYVLIGEYYFDKNEAFPALRAYLKATSYKDHSRWAYAMYKLAWCYYNVEEYGKGIDTMKQVVAYSRENAEGDRQKVRLEEEALKDLVRFFADAGAMDEAYDYFSKLGKKDLIRAMLKRLASLYLEQGKFDESVSTYRRLIMESPQHRENPGYQEEIINAYRKMGAGDKVLDEIKRLRVEYGRTSAWWQANASDPDAQSEADNTIEKALRFTATDFNEQARKLEKAKHPDSGKMFDTAVQAYLVYMEDYNEHKNAYNVHYDFGELLWKLKRFEDAYGEYMKVVSLDPKGQHSRFCAESAIFAAEEMVKKEGGGDIQMKKEKVSKDVKPVPLSDWEQKLVDACKRYAELYPGDKKVEIATYKSAFLLYSRYHFTEAAEQFRTVIARWPNTSNAEFSAQLILDALAIKEEWVSLRDTSKAFFQQEGLGKKKFKDDMYDIYSKSSFRVIEVDFEKEQNYGKTADAYLAFYDEFPEFDKVDFALNNAAAYYYKADRVADSMKVRHILVEDERFGPKTKFYYGQVGYLGYDYERLADFEKASYYYDMLYSLYPEEREKIDKDKELEDKDTKLADMDARAADALYTSAVFHSAMGDWQGAVERYDTFLENFGADERVMDTRLTVGRLYEENEDWTKAAETFKGFYTEIKDAPPEFSFFARLHHGRAMFEMGKEKDARKLYESSVTMYEKLIADGGEPGAHTEFVAEMMYRLTEPDLDKQLERALKGAYPAGTSPSQSKIKKEDKAFKDSLQAKTGGLLDMEARYTEIINTGAGEWGLASLIALGRAYEDMSETLLEAPCPFYLTGDQCGFYRETIGDKAYGPQEKAVAAYQLALQKSFELNLYNDNTAFATRRLGELRPLDFPGLNEEFGKPGYTAEKSSSFDVETAIE